MSCCNKEKVMQMEDLKSSAVGFGFDISWIGDIISKYGDDVLNLLLEAMRGGFSKEFVMDVLGKFGPLVLEFLVNLLNKKKMRMNFAGDGLVEGEEVGLLDASIIEVLIQKYLPMIFEKYGDQLVQMVIEWIVNYLRNVQK